MRVYFFSGMGLGLTSLGSLVLCAGAGQGLPDQPTASSDSIHSVDQDELWKEVEKGEQAGPSQEHEDSISQYHLNKVAQIKKELSSTIEDIYIKTILKELGPAAAQCNIQIEEMPAYVDKELQEYAPTSFKTDNLVKKHQGYSTLLTRLTTRTDGPAYRIPNEVRDAFRAGQIKIAIEKDGC